MRVAFLLDENIAAPLADKLTKAGHDVERVVAVSELGEGERHRDSPVRSRT